MFNLDYEDAYNSNIPDKTDTKLGKAYNFFLSDTAVHFWEGGFKNEGAFPFLNNFKLVLTCLQAKYYFRWLFGQSKVVENLVKFFFEGRKV